MPLVTLQLSSRGHFTDVLMGLTLPLRALSLIVRTPRLLRISLLAACLTAVTLVLLVVLLWPQSQSLAESLVGDSTRWQHYTALVLSILIFGMLYIVGALTIPNVLLAPFQDPLSEATEVCCGSFVPNKISLQGLLRGIGASLAHTFLRVTFMTLGFMVLWPLHFLPVAGSIAWVVLSSAWTMFWLSVEYLSCPMGRHLYPFRHVAAVLFRRMPLALGFGAALWCLLWIPILNFFLVPVAIVAGTLLYRGLCAAGILPASPEAV